MGEFPSGQRGQTVNLLLLASVVRIHLLPPYLCNKIDAHLEKLVFTSFFCVLRVKISGVKPWMLFTGFHEKRESNPTQQKISNITADFEQILL